MNKTEFIGAVAEKGGYTRKEAEKAVNTVFSAVSDALVNGDSVAIAGFGVFEVHDRAAKECRNPKTGEPVTVEATRVPAFRAGKVLKNSVAK